MDIEKAKAEFTNYAEKYNLDSLWIERKYHHSYRVMMQSQNIAKSLDLTGEGVELAKIIGLLHDIARFEQWTKYKTFSDSQSIDHGNAGVEILEKDNFIRNFINEDTYDDIIKTAIRNHNKYKIEDGLKGEKLLYSKIIRDADKIDIFQESLDFFWETDEEKMEVGTSIISENYIDQFVRKAPILRTPKQTSLDRLISLVAFIFDLNFDYSKKFVYEKDFINRMLDNFEFSQEKAKQQIEIVREVANNFLKESL